VPYTLGFPDAKTLNYKFDKHVTIGKEFTFATAIEYELNADRFLGGPLNSSTVECFRKKLDGSVGDKIRYNKITQEFGILSNDNKIRSYYIPNPAPKPIGHGWGSNEKYFWHNCGQVRG
jgi:hypothetical protein